jgi:nucleoside-diphosphate-sugar epimerase
VSAQPVAAADPLVRLAGCRVLVTGGTGFLGTHLSRALGALGAEVHTVSRRPPAQADGAPSWHAADLAGAAAVGAVFDRTRPDVVFHLTSHGVGSPDLEHVLPTLHGDLVSTINVLTAATRCGTRVVLAASLEEPLTTRAVPPSPYAAAKWAGSGYARMFHALYETQVVITRPFMTYGPGQRPHKLIPHAILSLLRQQSPRLGSGRRMVDWVYVDDVVHGLLLAAAQPGVEGGEFDLGSGELVSVRDVIERLVRLTGTTARPAFGAERDRPFEVERVAELHATFARLGWTARVPLDQGLRQTMEWYRERGFDGGEAP